jgi:hypothetical protein
MPGITLDPVDAAEFAETLTLLTQWLSGSQEHALAASLAAFIGHPACNTGTLCADLPPAAAARSSSQAAAPTDRGRWPWSAATDQFPDESVRPPCP